MFAFSTKHEVIEEQQKRDQHEELEFYAMVYNYMHNTMKNNCCEICGFRFNSYIKWKRKQKKTSEILYSEHLTTNH